MKFTALIFISLLAFLTACGTSPPPTIPPGPFTPGLLMTSAPSANPTVASTTDPAATPDLPTATSVPPISTPANTVPPTSTPTVKPTTLPAPTATAANGGLDMHAVDWFKVVTTDSNLDYNGSVPMYGGGPWIGSKTQPHVEGFAQTDQKSILFADISGDGQNEAIIWVSSGGTAGNLGLLVYTAANHTPVFADSLAGYNIGGVADGNQLKVIEPIYNGWEPNCCPSGYFETRYRLQANKLTQVSRDEKPSPEAKQMTVEKYYELLRAKNYSDAYNNFLSATYRASHPYKSWVVDYADIISFTSTTSLNSDGTINVDLVTKDKQGHKTVTHHYVGAWKLIWVSTAKFKQWVLDSASFVEVKS